MINQEQQNTYFENNDFQFNFDFNMHQEVEVFDWNCYKFDFSKDEPLKAETQNCSSHCESIKNGSTNGEKTIHGSTADDSSIHNDCQNLFSGSEINLNALAILIRNQTDEKGIDFMVEKCLDLDYTSEPTPILRTLQRKTPLQKCELKKAYEAIRTWNIEFEEALGNRVGLTRNQVHKWHFDERKRREAIDARNKRQKTQE